MLRGAVDPAFRRSRAGTALAVYSRALLGRWSYDHPHERVAGLGGSVESPDLIARQREPVWPQTGFVLVGYTREGRQIRVSWFEDFRLD